jgi:hypothetical protein
VGGFHNLQGNKDLQRPNWTSTVQGWTVDGVFPTCGKTRTYNDQDVSTAPVSKGRVVVVQLSGLRSGVRTGNLVSHFGRDSEFWSFAFRISNLSS